MQRFWGPMPVDELTKRVYALLDPAIQAEGCDVLDVEMASEQGMRILRVYIDKPNGVKLEDCQKVSHAIGDLLDVEDIVPGSYHLEVSSPGLNRPLTKLRHFKDSVGTIVKIQTFDKIDNRQNFKGVLESVTDDRLTVQVDGQVYAVPLTAVRKASRLDEIQKQDPRRKS